MIDHMPKQDAVLPPRYPEATTIATLTAQLAEARAMAGAAREQTIAALEADREAGTKGRLIIEATWKPCVHGGGWWVARDADGFERLMAPDAFADDMEAALIAQDAELKRYRAALTEAKETLVEVKRDMCREAAPRWIMADFLNWAIVQRITASIVSTRAALGEKP